MAIAHVANRGSVAPQALLGTNTDSDASGFYSCASTNNMLVAVISGYHASGFSVSGITDTDARATWTLRLQADLQSAEGGQFRVEIWTASINSTASKATTVSCAANSYFAWCISEFSGLGASPTFQSGHDGATNTTTDGNVSGVAASADADNLCIGGLSIIQDSNANIIAPSGFTRTFVEQDAISVMGLSADYKINTTAQTESVAWSHDDCNDANDGWSAGLLVIGDGDGDGGGGGGRIMGSIGGEGGLAGAGGLAGKSGGLAG